MEFDVSFIDPLDVLNTGQVTENKKENKKVTAAHNSISALEYIMAITAEEWDLIAHYNIKKFGMGHINVGVPLTCVKLHKQGKVPSEKQMNKAVEIREKAYASGFDFVS